MPSDHEPTENPSSAAPPRQRVTIRDAMILVAALAVGAFGCRIGYASLFDGPWMPGQGSDSKRILLEWGYWTAFVGPVLAALTAGLLLSRLVWPRPPRRELFQQSGFVAAFVALVVTVKSILQVLPDILNGEGFSITIACGSSLDAASGGILATWLVLALGGHLRAERSWIDRALRAVAVLWILAGIASAVLPQIVSRWL